MKDDRLITATDDLQRFCAALALESAIALDTEFIREKTYYPKLCLIQLAGDAGAKAIDPLAPGIDLSPLISLLDDPAVLKVVHAGRQDIEIFYHATGRVPSPLFDTQIAAQAAGFGESVAYGELVQSMLGIRIDKASRFTDWARRPLSERQLVYALDDVIHLREAYVKLRQKLEREDRLFWVMEEMDSLYDGSQYVTLPDEAWRRLKAGNMRPKQLAALRALAAWREHEAIRRNVPRGFVLRDEVLLEIASSLPHTQDELSHIRGMERQSPRLCDTLLAHVADALATPSDTWPSPSPRTGLPAEASALAEMLQLLLKIRAGEASILPRLIATREELERFACGNREVRFLHGWRQELFGHYAEELLQGQLRIGYDPEKRKIVFK